MENKSIPLAMATLNILLADDHQLIRDGLKKYLETHPNARVVGEASDGQEALDLIEQLEVDILITDINMPGMDGLDLIRTVTEDYPNIPCIAVTMLEDAKAIRSVIKSGVRGYLLKNCSREELLKAIDEVAGGRTYFSPDVTEKVLQSMSNKKIAKPAPKGRFEVEEELTTRETEVLKLILTQCSNQEIADKLFISPRTVDAHKRNILEKTNAKNSVGLVLFALEKGLISEEWLQESQLIG